MSDEEEGTETVLAGEAAGPFEERRDAEAALVNGAFFGTAAGAFGDEASVVGGIPKEGILVNLKVAEGFAEFADLFVEEGDFLKVSGVLFPFVEFRIEGGFAMGIVR